MSLPLIHPRPRFKRDLEGALLDLVEHIEQIPAIDTKTFNKKLNERLSLYAPKLSGATQKTIDNLRTEMTTLFSLIETDGGISKASALTVRLHKTGDLIEYFRYFTASHQYPGGFNVRGKIQPLVDAGVKFKPGPYILQLLDSRSKSSNGDIEYLTAAEATHLVFNDLSVTRDSRSPRDTKSLILKNRLEGHQYNTKSDVIRYARDILDYMTYGRLLIQNFDGNYLINRYQYDVIDAIIADDRWFDGYASLTKETSSAEFRELKEDWFRYANEIVGERDFSATVESLRSSQQVDEDGADNSILPVIMGESLGLNMESGNADAKTVDLNAQEIGARGEVLTIAHERSTLKDIILSGQLKLIQKMNDSYGVGYDILSYEGYGDASERKYIEVKTTASSNPVTIRTFFLTPTEWGVASQLRSAYYVYRILLAPGSALLYVFQDPIGLFKRDIFDVSVRDGASFRLAAGRDIEEFRVELKGLVANV